MGNWCETCFISKLPIHWGEKVVGTIIYEDPTDISRDKSILLGFPIHGEYDEYGSIENITNEEEIKEYLNCFYFCGKNGAYEIKDLTTFIGDVNAGRIKFMHPDKKEILPLQFRFIKEELFDIIIDNTKSFSICGETYEEGVNKHISKFIKDYDDMVETFNSYAKPVSRDRFYEKYTFLFIDKSYLHMKNIPAFCDECWMIVPYILGNICTKNNVDENLSKVKEILFYKYALYLLSMGYSGYPESCFQSGENGSFQLHVANFVIREVNRLEKYSRHD